MFMIQIFYINKKYVPLYQLCNAPKKIPKNITLDGEIRLFWKHVNSRENNFCTHFEFCLHNYIKLHGEGGMEGVVAM